MLRTLTYMILGVLMSCSSAQKLSESERSALDALVNERSLIIESDWASPMTSTAFNQVANALLPPGSTTGRISLIGNPNYFKIKGDSIAAYLPYFGEGQLPGRRNNDHAIRFEGIPETSEVQWNDKKQRYDMRFGIKHQDDNEMYTIYITIYANKSGTIDINSSHRTPIRYSGTVSSLQ